MARMIIINILILVFWWGTTAIADESEEVYAGSDASAVIATNGNEVFFLRSANGIMGNYKTLCGLLDGKWYDICNVWYGKEISVIGDMIFLKSYTTAGLFDHTATEIHVQGFQLSEPFAECFHTYSKLSTDMTTAYHFAVDRIFKCTHDLKHDEYMISVVSETSSVANEIFVVGDCPEFYSTYMAYADDTDTAVTILDFNTMKTYAMPKEIFSAYGVTNIPQGVFLDKKLFYLQADGIYLMDFHENGNRLVVPVDQPQYFFIANDVLYTRYDDETLLAYALSTGKCSYFQCAIEKDERYVVANNKIYIAEYSPNSQARVNGYRTVELVVAD